MYIMYVYIYMLHYITIRNLTINNSCLVDSNPSDKYQSFGTAIPKIWKNDSYVPVTTNEVGICEGFNWIVCGIIWNI